MSGRLALYFLLIAVLMTASARADERCIGENGKAVWQSGPCRSAGSAADSATTNPAAADAAKGMPMRPRTADMIVPVPGVGDFSITIFSHLSTSISPPGASSATTVTLQSRSEYEPITLTLTFLPNDDSEAESREDQLARIRQIGKRYVKGSLEQKVIIKSLKTPIGNALMANFNRKTAPKSEYPSITVGRIARQKFSVSIEIHCNGPDSVAHDDALEVLTSIRLPN